MGRRHHGRQVSAKTAKKMKAINAELRAREALNASDVSGTMGARRQFREVGLEAASRSNRASERASRMARRVCNGGFALIRARLRPRARREATEGGDSRGCFSPRKTDFLAVESWMSQFSPSVYVRDATITVQLPNGRVAVVACWTVLEKYRWRRARYCEV